MSASSHTPLGTVLAIQYTGSNSTEVKAALGAAWAVYTSPSSTVASACQIGNEMIMNFFHPNDWLVSLPAYGTDTPTLANGFNVVQNTQFTQQYSA